MINLTDPMPARLTRTSCHALVILLTASLITTPAAAQTASASSAATVAPTVAVPSAASTLPSLGEGLDMTTSAERRLGDRIAYEIYRSAEYMDDAILADYVSGIWSRLMAAARQRGELTPELDERFAWQLLLMRDKAVNAFALPGGYMGVNLGLMAVVQSEDELASVLGHELSHITQRHIVRLITRQSNQAPWLIGAMILGALAAASNPSAAGAMIVGGQAAAAQGQLNFSRDMEREADRVGFGVMTQAGFDGHGFVSMFEKLQEANRFNDTGAFPYLRSHPLTTERIADMQARGELLPKRAANVLTPMHAMLAARARVLANPDVDAMRAVMTQVEAQSHRPLSLAPRSGLLYGGVLAAARLREFDSARRWMAQLEALNAADATAMYQAKLLHAELALTTGQLPEAAQALAEAAARAPASGAAPRALFLLRSSLALQTGKAAAAAEDLRLWVAEHPRDATAWQLLSSAYGAQQQTLRSIRADAESRIAQLDYAAARDRLRAAQDLARQGTASDAMESSIIDARARELESTLKEQALER